MGDSTTTDPLTEHEHENEIESPHHPAESPQKQPSLGINNTPLRRYAVLSAIQLLRRIKPLTGNVVFLSNKLCVKFGHFVQLSEASTLQFIAQHTSIPVPKVHCAFVHKDCTYILMDRIDGKMLLLDWRSRSAESKEKILQQLKEFVTELRSLPPPGPGISNVDGGPLFDFRFPTSNAIGPFKTIHEFHLFLRNGIQEWRSDVYPEVNRMIALQDRPWPMPVFTHGDLSSLNILARGDTVVGIIDWETSGWFPSYWEHSMAWYVNPRNIFWQEEVEKFLESTPEDMEMEEIRLRLFGHV
ncbi:hypothetical protein AGABI1DRAFT_79892 [Agaricus bisporus var. burnettii JB137-S8]|uniref:Aminoglycoside phosphotransferase domain-containing protein n=1 Tax=Agaricus bisporus var. burnettii (strain JB137-S8 / ATCC MYA-4627 / FGSC 10392) TaxID=597362 RepID=K5VLZ3_AGABU|nr:uncharacterized protein AGABI1DRAFT_79892 [Agaricus bisporus var. burnettii JB137-S8]EKM75444.1 hypothetical protein AGABI1DRAFT_79892 [Agaricus bisporus var. burnettii JB137-S8]